MYRIGFAEAENRRQLCGRGAEGTLERGQERRDPTECGVRDRLRDREPGERSATDRHSASSRGSEMVTVNPKNVQSVSRNVTSAPSRT